MNPLTQTQDHRTTGPQDHRTAKPKRRGKLLWPVAKISEDGTPALWFTFTHWLLLQPGIVRAYLDARKHLGELRARQTQRTAIRDQGGDWQQNKRLKDCACLDSWPSDLGNVDAMMEVFRAGWDAYHHVNEKENNEASWCRPWTPGTLQLRGDKDEASANAEELKRITEAAATHPVTDSLTHTSPQAVAA